MTKVLSLLRASMAYDAGKLGKERHRVTLAPGLNELSDADMAVLDKDTAFARHFDRGFYKLVERTPAPDPEPGADPLARKPGESKKEHAARLKAIDDAAKPAELSADDAALVEAYDAMSAEDQAEFLTALDDRQKALVDNRSKPA